MKSRRILSILFFLALLSFGCSPDIDDIYIDGDFYPTYLCTGEAPDYFYWEASHNIRVKILNAHDDEIGECASGTAVAGSYCEGEDGRIDGLPAVDIDNLPFMVKGKRRGQRRSYEWTPVLIDSPIWAEELLSAPGDLNYFFDVLVGRRQGMCIDWDEDGNCIDWEEICSYENRISCSQFTWSFNMLFSDRAVVLRVRNDNEIEIEVNNIIVAPGGTLAITERLHPIHVNISLQSYFEYTNKYEIVCGEIIFPSDKASVAEMLEYIPQYAISMYVKCDND